MISTDDGRPLADRVRPTHIDQFAGQEHLLKPGQPLRAAWEAKSAHSAVFWGPPGTGKTTLARLLADNADAEFITLSAVLGGIKEVRACVDRARQVRSDSSRKTVLFVDEVHRFNKIQQDAFLPHVEDGTLTLLGATTENPSFELNNALLSRLRVYVLKPLDGTTIQRLLETALTHPSGYKGVDIQLLPEHLSRLAMAADGDGRRALSFLELAVGLGTNEQDVEITDDIITHVVNEGSSRFDKRGDLFHDQISALHKAVRGSDPDAAVYWFCRMLRGGCDPEYLARRIVRIASEDIGNADPRALQLALNAWDSYLRLGTPEGELALAQAVIYLSCAAKSNAVYKAFKLAMDDTDTRETLPVPIHLRNAPTSLAKELGHGKAYRYAHDEPHAYAAGERYFPEDMDPRTYYHPVDRGLEAKIREKLEFLRNLDRQHQ